MPLGCAPSKEIPDLQRGSAPGAPFWPTFRSIQRRLPARGTPLFCWGLASLRPWAGPGVPRTDRPWYLRRIQRRKGTCVGSLWRVVPRRANGLPVDPRPVGAPTPTRPNATHFPSGVHARPSREERAQPVPYRNVFQGDRTLTLRDGALKSFSGRPSPLVSKPPGLRRTSSSL